MNWACLYKYKRAAQLWLANAASFFSYGNLFKSGHPIWPCRSSNHTAEGIGTAFQSVTSVVFMYGVFLVHRGCTPTARYGRMYETTHTRANITYLLYAHTHGRLQCTARWGDREHRNGNNNTTKPPLNFSNADSKHRIFLNELLTGLLWTHRRTTKWGPALLARVPKAGNMAQHKLVWTPGFGIRRVQWTWICVVSFVLTFLNSGTLGQGMYSCVHSGTA